MTTQPPAGCPFAGRVSIAAAGLRPAPRERGRPSGQVHARTVGARGGDEEAARARASEDRPRLPAVRAANAPPRQLAAHSSQDADRAALHFRAPRLLRQVPPAAATVRPSRRRPCRAPPRPPRKRRVPMPDGNSPPRPPKAALWASSRKVNIALTPVLTP